MAIAKEFPIKIGLEIHGYLNTVEKLFCKDKTFGDGVANSRVCPICTGQPGCKPMLPNKEAMVGLIRIGLVLGCRINHDKKLVWQRKHYDWADLPKGYQTTISGAYSVAVGVGGKFGGIGITEIHLEEDPAQWNPETGKVDYNRSGLPLIEIVTEPEFKSADEVVDWLRMLVHSLSYVKAINKGKGIKADVNVSTYGERVEIKNINSVANIKRAIEYEVERQLENHDVGIVQNRETLAYDEKKGKTIKMREKESGEDYRFIPEPDLPVIVLDVKEISRIGRELPEMPDVKLDKLVKKFKIDKKNAVILARNLELVEFVESLASHKVDVAKNVSWVTIELLRILNWNKKSLDEVCILPEHLAELISAVNRGEITVLKGKEIMNSFVPKSFSVGGKKKLGMISGSEVEKLCGEVIKKNKKAVDDFKGGNDSALNFLVGEVMKLSNRRAGFDEVRGCLGGILG